MKFKLKSEYTPAGDPAPKNGFAPLRCAAFDLDETAYVVSETFVSGMRKIKKPFLVTGREAAFR